MILAALGPLLLWAAPPAVTLEAALACYESLDYQCAEERLREALAATLAPGQQLRAWELDALLALANRDVSRARAAARVLVSLDPRFAPPGAPPRLLELLDEARPAPVAPLAPIARLDGTTLQVFGQDAERWTEGLGVEASGGVLLARRWHLELAVGYSDHLPRTFVLERLGLLTVLASAARQLPAGPFLLTVGAGLGAARVSVEGVTGDDTYWAGLVAAPVDLAWPIGAGFGLGVRIAPALLATDDDQGRLALSYLLPLTAGVRYIGGWP